MRCPECNKFVPMTTDGDPEFDGTVTGLEYESEIRLAHACEECGNELREANLSVSFSFASLLADEHEKCCADEDGGEQDHDFIVEEETFEVMESYVIGKRGVALKGRVRYGVQGHVIVTCGNCKATAEFNVENDGVEGSEFEECC